ncbi:hypothetical protein OU787_25870 [Kitasatospora sp. YST-16]|uniref:hypothetical protein n=1 Tax=Kitasatospora sp. YST-16 TaxID=2998080 RepID=UPI002283A70D|nr:hypothetical protein [Kitasatospora sp. YST-16]WAL74621.1 hypothetical protein OU787_25870 [Kitasatospora sp. YST-16]WNW40679.1 hypothetical protein RKE32_25805 [Streptomyces sp. Li-HN-5-13]
MTMPHVAFGWDHDAGEFAVIRGRHPRAVGEVLYQSGFWYRAADIEHNAWRQRASVDAHDQIRQAAGAARALVKAGVQVANWHRPEQSALEVLAHYEWLQSAEPFPDADLAAVTARSTAELELRAGLDDPLSREIAADVQDGRIVVEAIQRFDDEHWWLARLSEQLDQARPFVMIRYNSRDRNLSGTDRWNPSYGDLPRRDFRAFYQRDTSRPVPVSLRAAAAVRAPLARMSAAPSTPPPHASPAPLSGAHRSR